MSKLLLKDELWEKINPLLPPFKANPKSDRPRVPDRLALTGILFVKSDQRSELSYIRIGSLFGIICWRRLRDWQVAGIWQKV